MSLMLMIEGQKMLESIKMLQDTIRQRDELIKRLELAGDALSETQTYDLIQNINWRKAKEAKP